MQSQVYLHAYTYIHVLCTCLCASMCSYTYIHMYVYIDVYRDKFLHTDSYLSIDVCLFVKAVGMPVGLCACLLGHAFMRTSMRHTHTRTCMHTHSYKVMCKYALLLFCVKLVRTYIHVCTYIYIYIYIYIYTHIAAGGRIAGQ